MKWIGSITSTGLRLIRRFCEASMSRKGNYYDNAYAESFWSRLKTELLDGGSFPDLETARLEISHYVAYYNTVRRHSALDYQPPATFETQYLTTS